VEAIMIAARVKPAWLAAMLLAAQLAASAGSAAAPQAQQPPDAAAKTEDLTPEQRMQRRFPQPVRVGDLIGLPVLDYGDSTIGYIREVVRTPDDKIKLIVPYGHWFGWARTECFLAWCRRPVVLPIEAVAILGRQVAALDFAREEFDGLPTFDAAKATPIARDEMIRIAITRR
jgi:hypothetical protein